jgi:hypothetical protein
VSQNGQEGLKRERLEDVLQVDDEFLELGQPFLDVALQF